MADVAIWQDKGARANFEAKCKARLAELKDELSGKTGVVAIEPESGEHFIAATLGKANNAAFARHPDRWVYFVRLDDLNAAIMLPTW
jgi:hypothetical protein